jgi:DNA polymerase I-like protein with 3'-5' exonuclease and polymerase domains
VANNKLQMAMFPPQSDWLPPEHPFPEIFDAPEIAIDVETRDPDLRHRGPGWPTKNGEVVGYAIAVPGWSGYFPIGHLGGGNMDVRQINKYLKKVFECPADKIMHNAQYDLGWIRAMGFEVKGRIIDTMMTAALIDENRFSYSLNALCYEYLGKTKSEKLLVESAREFGVDPKAEMWKLPSIYVGPYASVDAEVTLELWHHFKTLLNNQELWDIWKLETSLLPHLVSMTERGMRVDVDQAERSKQVLMRREKETMARIKQLAGVNVEIWAAASVAKAFDKAGLDYPKTAKGSPSFTKLFLSEHPHELPKRIVEARNLNKIQGTFIDSILKYVGKDSRVHGHINQVRSDSGGTVSGRLSMSNPALQTIPARDPELGPMMRRLFLPEEGEIFAAIDYSQQEPRILTHYAQAFGNYRKVQMGGVEEFIKEYNENPDADFHSLVADLSGLPRKTAKVINLALMYGMGVQKLSQQLDISLDEAKSLTQQYHQKVPFVKQLTQGVQRYLDDPRSGGCIRSIRGRKCRFELFEPDTFEMTKAMPYDEAVAAYGPTTKLKRAFTYKALNRLIQASAADMTKQAMVNVCEAGKIPLLQVHDELAFSVANEAEARELAEIMEAAVPLSVPNKCDIELGPTWGDAKELN